MKIKLGIVLISLLAGTFLGVMLEKLFVNQRRMAGGSITTQTLTDLSRALEVEKQRSGVYPELIAGLSVSPAGGDFSQDVLKRVIYRKTTNGYVAFVGSPIVAYIEPDEPARIEPVAKRLRK